MEWGLNVTGKDSVPDSTLFSKNTHPQGQKAATLTLTLRTTGPGEKPQCLAKNGLPQYTSIWIRVPVCRYFTSGTSWCRCFYTMWTLAHWVLCKIFPVSLSNITTPRNFPAPPLTKLLSDMAPYHLRLYSRQHPSHQEHHSRTQQWVWGSLDPFSSWLHCTCRVTTTQIRAAYMATDLTTSILPPPNCFECRREHTC